jgi:hypothetical protein
LRKRGEEMKSTGRCHSCEVVNINGVRTHEHGCPDAWRDEVRECAECGGEFEPEDSHQTYCDHACFCAAYGIRDDEGEEEEAATDCEICGGYADSDHTCPEDEELDEGDISDSYDPAPLVTTAPTASGRATAARATVLTRAGYACLGLAALALCASLSACGGFSAQRLPRGSSSTCSLGVVVCAQMAARERAELEAIATRAFAEAGAAKKRAAGARLKGGK